MTKDEIFRKVIEDLKRPKPFWEKHRFVIDCAVFALILVLMMFMWWLLAMRPVPHGVEVQ